MKELQHQDYKSVEHTQLDTMSKYHMSGAPHKKPNKSATVLSQVWKYVVKNIYK